MNLVTKELNIRGVDLVVKAEVFPATDRSPEQIEIVSITVGDKDIVELLEPQLMEIAILFMNA